MSAIWTAVPTLENHKKRRNRLAQRKHRQRVTNKLAWAALDSELNPTIADEAIPQSFAAGSACSVDYYAVDPLAASGPHHQHHIASAAQQDISLAQLSCCNGSARLPSESVKQPDNCHTHGQSRDNHEHQPLMQPMCPPQNENSIFSVCQETNNVSLPNTWELNTESWSFSDCQDWDSIDFSSAGPSRELCESLSATSPSHANESLSSHRIGYLSLEARMERIMGVVKEMNFDNMDAMISAYYTSKFKEDTLANWAQSTSRSRRIRKFLTELEQSAQDWSESEVQGYREATVLSAERHYVNEFLNHQQATYRPRNNTEKADPQRSLTEIPHQVCLDDATKRSMKEGGTFLREQIPDIWSLLTELARTVNVGEPQRSEAISFFLYQLDLP
ncbi:hypothetical protein V500_03467 [Pseudogymnoascus sp. VKM F-4518 (FW-2643)]|nr:hypothetical protein V500_03467 [Pseudogymnoascus sp. VKM F-4518 (FW-2643)]